MTDRVYEPPVDELAKKPAAARLQFQAFSLIFFVSGGTSLVYQVTWVRELSLFFGSDVYSAAITLASFMGGLGCGSWLAGRAAGWLRRPLLAYGILEILVALYVLAFPAILGRAPPDSSRIRIEASWIGRGDLTVATKVIFSPKLTKATTFSSSTASWYCAAACPAFDSTS